MTKATNDLVDILLDMHDDKAEDALAYAQEKAEADPTGGYYAEAVDILKALVAPQANA